MFERGKRIFSTEKFSSFLPLLATALVLMGAVSFFLMPEASPAGNFLYVSERAHPVYEDRDLTRRSSFLIKPGEIYFVKDTAQIFLKPVQFGIYDYYRYLVQAYEIEAPGVGSLWFTDSIVAEIDTKDKSVEISPLKSPAYGLIPLVLVLLGLAAGTFSLKDRAGLPWLQTGGMLCGYILLWHAGLAMLLALNGIPAVHNNGDMGQFHQVAREWMEGSRATPGPQVGGALLAAPFILLYGAESYFDYIMAYSTFNSAIVVGGVLAFSLLIALKAGGGRLAFHATACVFIVLSLSYWIFERADLGYFTGFQFSSDYPFAVPLLNKMFLTGWNGLGDNIAEFMIFGALATFVCMKGTFKYALAGLLMGLAFSSRYGSLPAIAAILVYDLLDRRGRNLGHGNFVLCYSTLLLFGLLGASPQLIDNLVVNGSPFRPTAAESLYHDGDRVANLFGPGNILAGMKLYLQANFKTLMLFSLCVPFATSRKLAASLLLLVWGVVLFHASLNFYAHSCMRYLLPVFPAAFLAAGLAVGGLGSPKAFYLAVAMLPCFLLCDPETGIVLHQFFPKSLQMALPLALGLAMMAAGSRLRFERAETLFISLFFILYATGSWMAPPLLTVAAAAFLMFLGLCERRGQAVRQQGQAEAERLS